MELNSASASDREDIKKEKQSKEDFDQKVTTKAVFDLMSKACSELRFRMIEANILVEQRLLEIEQANKVSFTKL